MLVDSHLLWVLHNEILIDRGIWAAVGKEEPDVGLVMATPLFWMRLWRTAGMKMYFAKVETFVTRTLAPPVQLILHRNPDVPEHFMLPISLNPAGLTAGLTLTIHDVSLEFTID